MRTLRALDLYSGIGGWRLGLKLAGIDTIASCEYWLPAIITQNKNFETSDQPIDIRSMQLSYVDRSANLVVGSPPCTQFSSSNRGGKGDISDGLIDIAKFLEIVEYVKPIYWAMENVPRVAGILEFELDYGSLQRFRHLVKTIEIFDFSEFGLPQRRRRMIAGDYPVDVFRSYMKGKESPTLGLVLKNLRSRGNVRDPNYDLTIHRTQLTDQNYEQALTDEQERINRANKEFHPVYNVMNYPDRIDRASRTITATCTKVSRESLIVRRLRGGVRRLTVRERATLQGFPITYQFYGSSYSNRIKMIGNAVPPLLTYYLGCSMLNTSVADANLRTNIKYSLNITDEAAEIFSPKLERASYPAGRRFRFAIPNLRFGSGVRFELCNNHLGNSKDWRIKYFYGVPDDIREIRLGKVLLRKTLNFLKSPHVEASLSNGMKNIIQLSGDEMQSAWSHRTNSISPLEILDNLGDIAMNLHELFGLSSDREARLKFIIQEHNYGKTHGGNHLSLKRYNANIDWLLCGFLIGSWYNSKSR